MKTHFILYSVLLAVLSFVTISCDKESIPREGGVRIEFDNIAGDKNLILNGVTYSTPLGENFTVSTLNYYVSNIKLNRADGSAFVVPKDQSYFLIKEDTKSSQMITLPQVPEGEYTSLEFVLGVDSLKSTSPLTERIGVLDPGNGEGMYWSWNSGYIFLKLEGTSPSAASEKFNYHIGFFGGYSEKTPNNNRTIHLPFSHPISVSETSTPEIHVMADILKFFNGPGTQLKIADISNIMGGQPQKAEQVANNYAEMFTIDHIH